MINTLQRAVSNVLSWLQIYELYKKYIQIYSLWSNWQYSIIRFDNWLAPDRWQAIIWFNDDVVSRLMYEPLSPDELNPQL